MSNSAFNVGGGSSGGTVSSVTVASDNTAALEVTDPTVTSSGTITLTPHGNFISQQVLTVGSGTYTKPDNVTSILIQMQGGGGGAGGAPAALGSQGAGGGGAGGAWLQKYIAAAAATYTYVVGAGGAGGAAGNHNGSNGVDTTFDGGAIVAGGGSGGTSAAVAAIGAGNVILGSAGSGGTHSGGDFGLEGSPGTIGIGFGTFVQGGLGGASFWCTETGEITTGSSANGDNATDHGGGGSAGATYNTVTPGAGGNGSDGLIVVYEYA